MPEHLPLTPETIASLPVASDAQLSPDGSHVAWSMSPFGRTGKHPEGGVWVARVPAAGADPTSSGARRWTYGGDDSMPRWSPDGTRIAFLSDRAERGTRGLYVIELAGGEARAVVTRKRSVDAFAWAPDGQSIAFLAPDEPTEDDERREKERDDAAVYGERWALARVWSVAIGHGGKAHDPELLWAPEGRHVTELAWAPDGTRLALLDNAAPPAQYLTTTRLSVISVADPDGGEGGVIAQTPMCRNVGWCGDDTLALSGFHDHEAQASATLWAVATTEGAEPRVVGTGRDEPRCTVGLAHVVGGDRVVAVVAEGLGSRLELVDPATATRSAAIDLGGECGDLSAVRGDGGPVLALVHYGDGVVGRVLAGPLDDLRLVHDHASDAEQAKVLAQTVISAPEPLHTTATDGTTLDAVVLRPAGPDAGEGPWPTAVLVHGGPYYRSSLDSHTHPLDWGQLLASHGYAVVLPNYRGGLGHGHDFATQARGTMGSVEWDDVTAIVDAAVGAGIADPDRLGIAGWSQGGFLTAWAVTATDRYRVGVMGAGVSDWSMMAATSDLPDFEAALGGSRPWDGIGPHRAAIGSPLSHAGRRTTPLLILHGAEDQRVPLSQATAFHRALAGQDAPLDLVVYPREPHGLKEWQHQVDAQRRVLEWFERYLR
ncbi:S9 family peptidase [soil metagenome]